MGTPPLPFLFVCFRPHLQQMKVPKPVSLLWTEFCFFFFLFMYLSSCQVVKFQSSVIISLISASFSHSHCHHPSAGHYGLMPELLLFFFAFCLFRAAPVAYGGSQARGLVRGTAANLHQSHSNLRSEPRLRPTLQLTATHDP